MKTKLDKNAEKFVSLMVEKIESISTNWEKPWFSNIASKQNFIPQNLSGRLYSGGNLFMLLMLCEEHNYQTPVFLTFNQAKNENISILKGAVSFPVYHTSFVLTIGKPMRKYLSQIIRNLLRKKKRIIDWFLIIIISQYSI